jgi:hypothetical protein
MSTADLTRRTWETRVLTRCDECGTLCDDVKTRERYWPKYEKQTSCNACFLKRNRENYAGGPQC